MLPAMLLLGIAQVQVEGVPLAGNELFDDLGKYWREQMPAYGVTGFAVGAVRDGKVVLLDAVGNADPIAGKKADIDTRYYIASVTKTMTAAAVAQLAEEGKIDLDAPVQQYLPRFTLADKEFARAVTVRDLLCHRPGITGGDVVLLDAYTGGITEDRYYAMLAESRPTKEVRYTNVHYTLLGRLIEAVSDLTWKDYLAANVFKPNGMSRTTAYISASHDDLNVAPPLIPSPNGPTPSPYTKTDRTMHAAGGVMSTARDMTRYLLSLVNDGAAPNGHFLKAATIADSWKHQSNFPLDGSIRRLDGFGYAWNVGDYRDTKGFAAHGGGYTGYSAYVAIVPSRRAGVVVLINTGITGPAMGTVMAVDMLDRLLGYPIDAGVRKAYAEQAESVMKRIAGSAPIAPNPAVSGLLSLKSEAYVGRYSNERYGAWIFRLSGGYLRADWDDLPAALKSTGKDEFTAHRELGDRGLRARFVVENGQVKALELDLDESKVRFERS